MTVDASGVGIDCATGVSVVVGAMVLVDVGVATVAGGAVDVGGPSDVTVVAGGEAESDDSPSLPAHPATAIAAAVSATADLRINNLRGILRREATVRT